MSTDRRVRGETGATFVVEDDMLASSSKDAGYRESAGLPRASDIVVPRPIRRSPAPRVALVVGIVALALALPFVGMAGRLLSRASSTVSTPLARR